MTTAASFRFEPETILDAVAGKDTDQPTRIPINPETVEQDLARLVLGLMAFLRTLMERQAIHRMEAGTLTPEEEERVGMTLMRAEEALFDLAKKFDLKPEDLALDLGPLGKTI